MSEPHGTALIVRDPDGSIYRDVKAAVAAGDPVFISTDKKMWKQLINWLNNFPNDQENPTTIRIV